MKYFTVEEINLMCCFNTSSRKRLIDDMKSVTLNNTDSEIAEIVASEENFERACETLIAGACGAGGTDNITVVLYTK